jgi:hypothetical protein
MLIQEVDHCLDLDPNQEAISRMKESAKADSFISYTVNVLIC